MVDGGRCTRWTADHRLAGRDASHDRDRSRPAERRGCRPNARGTRTDRSPVTHPSPTISTPAISPGTMMLQRIEIIRGDRFVGVEARGVVCGHMMRYHRCSVRSEEPLLDDGWIPRRMGIILSPCRRGDENQQECDSEEGATRNGQHGRGPWMVVREVKANGASADRSRGTFMLRSILSAPVWMDQEGYGNNRLLWWKGFRFHSPKPIISFKKQTKNNPSRHDRLESSFSGGRSGCRADFRRTEILINSGDSPESRRFTAFVSSKPRPIGCNVAIVCYNVNGGRKT